MHEINLSEPYFVSEIGICFSAYNVQSGYCAFALSFDVAKRLGAKASDREAMLEAFVINHQRIEHAVSQKGLASEGTRIMLGWGDFL